jgi:hypothetical protein
LPESEGNNNSTRGRETLGVGRENRGLLPQSGARGEMLLDAKKSSAEAEADDFLNNLLGRWESVSVEEARLVFVELNGWSPDEEIIRRRNGYGFKRWYWRKFKRMAEDRQRFLRTKRGRKFGYSWAEWGDVRFPDTLKALEPIVKKKKKPTERKGGASMDGADAGGLPPSSLRKREAGQGGEEKKGASKRPRCEEDAVVRKADPATVACPRGVRAPAEVASTKPQVTSEDPASAVIRDLLRRRGKWRELEETTGEVNGSDTRAERRPDNSTEADRTNGTAGRKAAELMENEETEALIAPVNLFDIFLEESERGRVVVPHPDGTERQLKSGSKRRTLEHYRKASLKRIRTVFRQTTGWVPDEAPLERAHIDPRKWYRRQFEKMLETGKRLMRTPRARGPNCFRYSLRQWPEELQPLEDENRCGLESGITLIDRNGMQPSESDEDSRGGEQTAGGCDEVFICTGFDEQEETGTGPEAGLSRTAAKKGTDLLEQMLGSEDGTEDENYNRFLDMAIDWLLDRLTKILM